MKYVIYDYDEDEVVAGPYETHQEAVDELDPGEESCIVTGLLVEETTERTLEIEVEGGVVTDVRNLPEGWSYAIVDRDVSGQDLDAT